MRVKVLGMQFKFLFTLIISFILGFLFTLLINKVFVTSNKYIENYTSSSHDLSYICTRLNLDINNETPNTINDYKLILKKYETNYREYKVNFTITDGSNTIYMSKKNTINLNFKKAFNDTLINAFSNRGDITHYYNFAYKIPIQLNNKVMELRLMATPINYKSSSLIIPEWALLIMILILTIIIFYILTLPKVKYISSICNGLDIIANGNLDFKIEEKGNDELSSICEYINHMSNELKERIAKEKELEISKQALITNVAHDIRSPLTSIIGFLELVKNKEYKSNYEMDKYINISLKKAETMKNLTNNLFMFTKLNSAELKFNFTPICLNDIIYQLIDEFEPNFEMKNLILSDEITPEKILVNIDINMFVRAISNLFSNALKYSIVPSEVKVSLRKDKNTAIFSISNKCKEINIHDINMLFERFYRADKSRSDPDNGSGLGLSIAKNIIERHGGDISVKSQNNIIYFLVVLKTI